jgi:16S rRNA (uracil1498-N3)-methyltransferase
MEIRAGQRSCAVDAGDNASVLPRFLARDVEQSGTRTALTTEEGEHLVRVLRLRAGDPLRVFNGRGGEFEATVESIERGRVSVTVGDPCTPAPEARIALTLVQAVLKGDKMDQVVRDVVMLGAAAIQPILSARSDVSATALARGRRPDRWERIAVSSAKQSGRAVVPRIYEPRAFLDVLRDVGAAELPAPALMLVEPSRGASANDHGCGHAAAAATVFVGPEGGWATEEIANAGRSCRLTTFGGRTLRADVAAVVAMTAVLTLWDGF